jgi:hypothetical protein
MLPFITECKSVYIQYQYKMRGYISFLLIFNMHHCKRMYVYYKIKGKFYVHDILYFKSLLYIAAIAATLLLHYSSHHD